MVYLNLQIRRNHLPLIFNLLLYAFFLTVIYVCRSVLSNHKDFWWIIALESIYAVLSESDNVVIYCLFWCKTGKFCQVYGDDNSLIQKPSNINLQVFLSHSFLASTSLWLCEGFRFLKRCFETPKNIFEMIFWNAVKICTHSNYLVTGGGNSIAR